MEDIYAGTFEATQERSKKLEEDLTKNPGNYRVLTGKAPEIIADEIGDGGSGKLKKVLTETLNEYLKPIREKRSVLEANPDYIRQVLKSGIFEARKIATETLEEVREVMNMGI